MPGANSEQITDKSAPQVRQVRQLLDHFLPDHLLKQIQQSWIATYNIIDQFLVA